MQIHKFSIGKFEIIYKTQVLDISIWPIEKNVIVLCQNTELPLSDIVRIKQTNPDSKCLQILSRSFV